MGETVSFDSQVQDKDDLGIEITPKDFVRSKIVKSSYYHKKFRDNIEEISEFLSDKQKLLDTYLSTDWLVTRQLQERMVKSLDSVTNEELNDDEEGGVFSPPPSEEGEEEMDIFDKSLSMEEMQNIRQLADYQLEHSVKIKFIVSEILRLRTKPLKKFYYFNVATPFLNLMNTLPDFGIYHIAVQVGPWIIELNSSGLCVPRKLASRAALISADVREIATKDDVMKCLDTIADVIIRWNTSVHYNKHGGNPNNEKGRKSGNCQQFLEELLEELGVNMNEVIKGPMKRYVNRIVHDGWAKLDFISDKAFKKKFGMKHRTVTFTTHEQIDKFVIDCIKKDPLFQANHPDEYALLKSFDRAIWLKHIRYPEKPKFMPHREQVEVDYDSEEEEEDGEKDDDEDDDKLEWVCRCPFNDPRVTKSFVFPKLKSAFDQKPKEIEDDWIVVKKKEKEEEEEEEEEKKEKKEEEEEKEE